MRARRAAAHLVGLRRVCAPAAAKQEVPTDAMLRATALVRKFVENYHEKLEEDFLFPEFERRDRLTPLVKVLRQQHAAGRALTDAMAKQFAANEVPPAAKADLAKACRALRACTAPTRPARTRCSSPPCGRSSPAKLLDELGDKFEKEEDRLFGGNGFGKGVEEVLRHRTATGDSRPGQVYAQSGQVKSRDRHTQAVVGELSVARNVGWVERSEPHRNMPDNRSRQLSGFPVGLAPLDPPYDPYDLVWSSNMKSYLLAFGNGRLNAVRGIRGPAGPGGREAAEGDRQPDGFAARPAFANLGLGRSRRSG